MTKRTETREIGAPLHSLPPLGIFWILLIFLLGMVGAGFFLGDMLLGITLGGIAAGAALAVFFYAIRIERAHTLQSLEEEGLRQIITNFSDAIVIYEKDFSIVFWNQAAEQLFRLPAEKALGHTVSPQDAEDYSWRLLVQVVFPSLAPVMVNETEQGAYPQVMQLSFEDPEVELRVTTLAVTDKGGAPSRFIKVIHDRTREVAIARSKNEFITVASHQLRTPITGISWTFETLKNEAGLSPEGKVIVEKASGESRQLLGIVEDLLKVSKIEEGRFGYNFQPVNIMSFIEAALEEFVPHARRVGVAVYFDRPKEAFPDVLLDLEKLGMAFKNILDNALRYNVENGQITVKAARLDTRPFIEVSVKDTGIGVPPQDMGKLFTKFFRAQNALKFKTEGSGLGLYIAKNIIRAHGGEIWAESELERGSTFHFTLPTDKNLVPVKEMPLEY